MCVDRFNIADVARVLGLEVLRERGGETYAVCPFCGDRRGKFSYIVKKADKENMYKCWHCNEGGTAIDLYMRLKNKPEYGSTDGYKAAIRDIFKDMGSDSGFEAKHRENEKKAAEAAAGTERASDGRCSSVYYAMLKHLTLRDEHKADLLKRGFTEEDIKRFRFKTIPEDTRFLCKRLIKDGYDLEGVPGTFMNKYGSWMLAFPGFKEGGQWKQDSGYFCPVFDGERNILLGFQIRIDHPREEQPKYLWFSSSGKEKGVSSGAMSSYLPGKKENVIIITEGILKALCVYSLLKGEVSVMGVPGVKAIKSLEGYLDRFGDNAFIFEAYDMDKAIKTDDPKLKEKTERLAEDTKKLHSFIEERGIPLHPLKWDMDSDGNWKGNYKGLDDFLAAYDKKEMFISYLLKKSEDALKLKEYFNNCKTA